jgi:hypothetical protein
MSLTDIVWIGIQVFGGLILLWSVLFVVICALMAIFVSLMLLFMSRI